METLVEESFHALLQPQPGERVLDIGCGDGNHLLFFNKSGLDISGLDASPYMVRRAKERLGDRSSLKVGFAEDLPFDDNEFDLATLINTLEFVDNPLEAMREAGRVARRGVFIGVMNSISWYCLSTKLESLFRRSLFNHVIFYNLWELKSYVQSAFGNVPVKWRCAPFRTALLERLCDAFSARWYLEHCPFRAFLVLSATMRYWLRTDQRPLKVNLEKAGGSIVSGVTRGKLPCVEVTPKNERSISV
ncbi:MAG: class I SAM-dependent methyltransferase [Desulfobacteraceae bacterium]|jgi:SAM-dependent methyltransferase